MEIFLLLTKRITDRGENVQAGNRTWILGKTHEYSTAKLTGRNQVWHLSISYVSNAAIAAQDVKHTTLGHT